MSDILLILLEKLKKTQSWCPMCEMEHVCDFDCVLKDLWFEKRFEKENE